MHLHRSYGRAMAALMATSVCGWLTSPPALAEIKVVVTIKPLHSLVSHVMAGAGTPELLVKGTASAHTYALKPSDASSLGQADVFFRMSETMEPFTAKIAKSLPKSVQVITLQSTRGLKLYPRRTGATFEGEDDHGHAGHDHAHGNDKMDGHAWLDPVNAKALADRIAQVLAAKEPAKAGLYRANAAALKTKLDELSAELSRDLAPAAGKPYVVFHDALQYFERRFGLTAVGSIAISPEVAPSAKRLSTLRKKIASLGAVCIFTEPQFDTRLIENVAEGTKARTGPIDPEGAKIEPGPDLYFQLLRGLARDLKGCLTPQA
jgi:zinc transport system substrate-binding protein